MTLHEDCQRCGNGTWAWKIKTVKVDVVGAYRREWQLCEECSAELVDFLKKFAGEPTRKTEKP